ncbi:hypothetical protein GCM10027400_18210 [Pseudoxanthomonas daejeonensis]
MTTHTISTIMCASYAFCEEAVTPRPMFNCQRCGSADWAQASAGDANSAPVAINRFHQPFACIIA